MTSLWAASDLHVVAQRDFVDHDAAADERIALAIPPTAGTLLFSKVPDLVVRLCFCAKTFDLVVDPSDDAGLRYLGDCRGFNDGQILRLHLVERRTLRNGDHRK